MGNKRKVFISYDYQKDKHYKNLLLAWDAHQRFEFFISDYSADISINSTKSSPIKRTLSRYINEGTVFLVIIGKNTHKSKWVKWEIEKAEELGKKIVAVKIDRENVTPSELFNIGASWAMSFTQEAITRAIENA